MQLTVHPVKGQTRFTEVESHFITPPKGDTPAFRKNGPFASSEYTHVTPSLEPLYLPFPPPDAGLSAKFTLCRGILGPFNLQWPHADPSLHILFTSTVPRAISYLSTLLWALEGRPHQWTVLSGSLASWLPAGSANEVTRPGPVGCSCRAPASASQFHTFVSAAPPGGFSPRLPATPRPPLVPAPPSFPRPCLSELILH